MLRLFRQTVAAASLILLAIGVAIWIRSAYVADELTYSTYEVAPPETPDDHDDDYDKPRPPDPSRDLTQIDPADREFDMILYRRYWEGVKRRLAQRRTGSHFGLTVGAGILCAAYDSADYRSRACLPILQWESYEDPTKAAAPWPGSGAPDWGFDSFTQGRVRSGSGGSRDEETGWTLRLPLWAIVAALAPWPLLWFRGIWRRQFVFRRRLRRGCCVGCGYDLRASPGRCPECGEKREFGPGDGRWASGFREILPLGIAALALCGGFATALDRINDRHVAMERLFRKDERQQFGSDRAFRAIDCRNAAALKLALRLGDVLGPEEAKYQLKDFIDDPDGEAVALLLIDVSGDPSTMPGSYLPRAIRRENYEVAKRLINRGVDVNAPEPAEGTLPLHWCIRTDMKPEGFELFKLLLKKGASPSGRIDINSETTLHHLVYLEVLSKETVPYRMEMANLLLERGADVNAIVGEGRFTPLDRAGRDESDPLVQLLIKSGGIRNQPQ